MNIGERVKVFKHFLKKEDGFIIEAIEMFIGAFIILIFAGSIIALVQGNIGLGLTGFAVIIVPFVIYEVLYHLFEDEPLRLLLVIGGIVSLVGLVLFFIYIPVVGIVIVSLAVLAGIGYGVYRYVDNKRYYEDYKEEYKPSRDYEETPIDETSLGFKVTPSDISNGIVGIPGRTPLHVIRPAPKTASSFNGSRIEKSSDYTFSFEEGRSQIESEVSNEDLDDFTDKFYKGFSKYNPDFLETPLEDIVLPLNRWTGCPEIPDDVKRLFISGGPVLYDARIIELIDNDFIEKLFYDWVRDAMVSHASKPADFPDDAESKWNATSSSELPIDWAERKKAVRKREENRCAVCGSDLKNKEGNTHHIVARNEKGNHELTNLVLLCKGCHSVIGEKHEGIHWQNPADFKKKRFERIAVIEPHLLKEHLIAGRFKYRVEGVLPEVCLHRS